MRVIEQAAKAASDKMIQLWIERNPNGGQLGGWESESDEFRSDWIAGIEAALRVVDSQCRHALQGNSRRMEKIAAEREYNPSSSCYLDTDIEDFKRIHGSPPPLPDDLWNRKIMQPLAKVDLDDFVCDIGKTVEVECQGHRFSGPLKELHDLHEETKRLHEKFIATPLVGKQPHVVVQGRLHPADDVQPDATVG